MEFLNIERFWPLIQEKLQSWAEISIKHLPNFVVALVVIIAFSVLARLVASAVRNVLTRSFDSQQIAYLLAGVVKILVLGAGLFVALDFLGLKGTVTSLLAGAGIIGLAIGFAFQDMTENLIAGVVMGIRKPFKIGDVIEADKVFGEVVSINLRNTLVRSFYGQILVVPNKLLFRNVVTNYCEENVRRIEIPVGISYADDIEAAEESLVEAINALDFVIRQDETAVYAEGFGASSVDLLVWFWIAYPKTNYMQARHLGVKAVKQALAQADIQIPFPIRTVDFGIKGGERLAQVLESASSK